MGTTMYEVEKYGNAVDAGELTFEEAVSLLVEARCGLARLGAADLLANWRTARDDKTELVVPPEEPAEHLALVRQYGNRSRARIADLDFAVKSGIVPARIQD
ncbi:hypothetical protein [Streptomyces sp. NPDC015125]|uniref:hypothetical protein n=1 Tax=Streptomyces sp. NPDC015125 TaxID=3364938 RepID=UPI0036FDE8C0